MKILLREIRESLAAFEDRQLQAQPTKIDQLCRAIAFQHQVRLGYSGTVRTIEPHVIRETRGCRLLLYALKVEEGSAPELRSYRLDRVESVEVTSEPFVGPEHD
jgi:predicted DNA-binding transcriptional regulator YafY